jgi:hypothetical protein
MRATPVTRQGDKRLALSKMINCPARTPRFYDQLESVSDLRGTQRGSYLLEFALAALGVAFFIVGVSDLAKIFQARGAVHAGVSEGLRCLYPTDPTCANVTLPNAEITGSRFNAWVWGSEGTLLPQSSFLVSTSLFNEPVREAPRMASKLSSVRVSHAQTAYAPHSVQFPVSAHAPYLLTIRDLPRIGGDDPMRPTFRDRYTGQDITPNRAFAIQAIRGTGQRSTSNTRRTEYDSSFEIGSRSFTLADAWAQRSSDSDALVNISSQYGREVPCYRGATDSSSGAYRIKWSQTQAPTTCTHREQQSSGSTTQGTLLQGVSLRVPLMIRVSGVPVGMASTAVGKIVARLEWRSAESSGSRDLGGRVFSRGSSGNLIVRGADKSDIYASSWSPYEERYSREVELHGTLPLIPVGSTVTVRLFLSSVDGEPVGWEGREIEVFYPRYQFVHEIHSCGYSANPQACAISPAPIRALYTALDTSRELVTKQERSQQCDRNEPTPLEQSADSVVSRFTDSIRRGESPRGYSFWLATQQGSGACAPTLKTYSCADDYQEHLKGCGPTYSTDYVQSRCRMDDFRAGVDQIADMFVDSQARADVEKRGGCSEEPFPECAVPYVTDNGTRFFGGAANNCSSAINVSPASERVGPLYDNLCESVSDRVRERYRTLHKVPTDIPISVVSLPEPPVFSAGVPSDSCVASEPALGGDQRRVLCGRSLSRVAARRCCDRHEGRCSLEELPPPPGRINGGIMTVMEEAAENRVIETIQAIYPRAQGPSSCEAGSENCINVDARVTANDSIARVQASVRVPLTLAPWFLSDGITLEYQEERALERALMNG